MFEYLKKENLDNELQKLNTLPKDSEEWFFQHMKLTLSFGAGVRLTPKGYDYGVKVAEKIDMNEEITREEMMRFGFISSQMTVMEDPKKLQEVNRVYEKMINKYKPDMTYLQELVQYQMAQEGLMEVNPDYIKSIATMFVKDFAYKGSPVGNMLSSEVLPHTYESLQKCPFCSLKFDEADVLMKHVEENHAKDISKD